MPFKRGSYPNPSISRMRFPLAGHLAAVVAFVAPGCVTVHVEAPLASYRDAVSEASAAVGAYFSEVNSFERDLYFDELRTDPSKEVLAVDGTGKRTPLLGQTLSAESVRARLDSLALLAAYGARLAELAGAQAPSKLPQEGRALGDAIANLETTFRSLHGDAKAPDYAGPIGFVMGVLGEMYVESKRDDALRKAIREGTPKVDRILELLEADLLLVAGPIRKLGAQQMLVERMDEYNRNRGRWSREQRSAALEDIRAAARGYELALVAQPVSLIAAIRTANHSVVAVASTDRSPASIAELRGSVDSLAAHVREALPALQELRDLRSGARR
jgi:hypothetical protein